MKRFILYLTVLLVIVPMAGCKNKENPDEGTGLAVKLTLPEGFTQALDLCVFADGVTYTKDVAAVSLSADKVLSTSIVLPPEVISSHDLLTVFVFDGDWEVYSGVLPLSSDKRSLQGPLSVSDYVAGDGTRTNPYLIANPRQLQNMMKLYKDSPAPSDLHAFKFWFELVADVAVNRISWSPLNIVSVIIDEVAYFPKAIDFNGNGHTITGLKCTGKTYASFAGVLYGSISNVIFDHATISGSGKKGVVAGFLGTTGTPGSCENVTVINSSVSGDSYSGGFAGHIRTTGTITGCRVKNTTVTSTNSYVGGFAGALDIAGADKYEVPARFVDCHVEDVTVNQESPSAGDTYYTGGFIGGSVQAGSYTDCTVKATINAKMAAVQSVGGFVGRTSYAGSNFRNCKVLSGTEINAAGAHVGGFVGFAETADSYDKCESNATVSSSGNYTGGFAGYANGSAAFTECSFSGSVSAAEYVGGFVGEADNASFRACCVRETKVAAQRYAGGFVGEASAASFMFDYAVVTYNGTPVSAGSFVGGNPSGQASFAYCIGWHQTAPFCGQDPVSSDFEHCYSGISGSVSSQAADDGWPATSWDFNGPYPVLKSGARIVNAIFVGDSITWQWGRNEGEYSKAKYPLKIDFNPSYMVDNGTTVTVKFHPGFFSRNGYIDKGISGQNTTQMKSRFMRDVVDHQPAVVAIMAGTNDLAQGVSEEGIRDNIASMAADAAAAGIKVVLCSVTPNNSSYSRLSNPKTKGAHIIKLNGLIQTLCAEKGYKYCDYWTALVANDESEASISTDVGFGLKANFKLYDDLHPGPDGYDVMEPIIKGIIDSLL